MISILAHNSIDTPAVIWGCHWAGLAVAPSSPLSNAREYSFQLKDSEAKKIVTERALLPVAREAARSAGLSDDDIVLMGDDAEGFPPFQRVADIGPKDALAGQQACRKKIRPSVDLAFLCYSSGTTGQPKGVMLSHTNIIANVLQNRACDSKHLTWNTSDIGDCTSQGDKMIGFLPFYHIYGT